jgi:phosphoribosylanthranilate isomerase
MTAVKICGLTREADTALAVSLGVQAVGFVLWPKSPRYVELARVKQIVASLPPFVTAVGVFVDPTAEDIANAVSAGIRLAQVHGAVPPSPALPVLRAVHLGGNADGLDAEVDPIETVLLDAYDPVLKGGTGRTIDWARAAAVAARRRVVLAGGLTPDNVRQAITEVRPYAVDVSSGVESSPGIKDPALMKAFIAEALTQGTSGTKGTYGT